MTVNSGFTKLQQEVDVPADALAEARRRRRVFRDSFRDVDEVKDAWGSGSLARSTHKDPIHDVDIVVVYDRAAHPTWGESGPSANDALEHTRQLAKSLLGDEGIDDVKIRRTLLRNHAVKFFIDDVDDSDAFTVDVTPALERQAGGIWIPEKVNETWVPSDPKELIRLIDDRQRVWSDFRPLVRMLKRWNSDHGKTMKSLVVEVLALEHLPEAPRDEALQRFFAGAAEAVLLGVYDPAHLTGEIDPDMDRYDAKTRLEDAASIAWDALVARRDDDEARAMCLWRELFGEIYPEPDEGCSQYASAGATAAATTLVNIAPARRPVKDAPQG